MQDKQARHERIPAPIFPGEDHYIIVAYTKEGELVGYLTERDTISDWREKAVRYFIADVAEGRASGLEGLPGYCAWIWAAEFVSGTHTVTVTQNRRR